MNLPEYTRLFMLVCLLFSMFCSDSGTFLHDVEIPLRNDAPEIISYKPGLDTLYDTLTYPDSVICTLLVSDLNDSVLHAYPMREGSGQDDTLFYDSAVWPGTIIQNGFSIDLKEIVLSLNKPVLGLFNGNLFVCDEQNSFCILPFSISRVFFESFDQILSDSTCWSRYYPEDTIHVGLKFPGPSLRYEFNPDQSDTGIVTAGIVSNFTVRRNFNIAVDFELRDEMLSGFDVIFLLTDRADTSRLVPRAGIYLSADLENVDRRLRMSVGVGINVTSVQTDFFSGTLSITRDDDSSLTFWYQEPVPTAVPVMLGTGFSFNPDSVYIHLRMNVDDYSRRRHCEWDNLKIREGNINL